MATILLLLLFLHLTSPCCSAGSRACPPNQRDSLFEFANSFLLQRLVWSPNFFVDSPPCDGPDSVASYPKTASWNLSVDCCGWAGVTCDELTGNVTGLDLRCSWLHGPLRSNTTLFRLPHLRRLDLSGNNFLGSSIPPEISVLEQLTYLNLSWGNFSGHVPSELSGLNKLASLDLSGNFNWIEGSSWERIARNLSVLSFLDLSYVDMSDAMPSSLMNLSTQMVYLSFRYCWLRGELPGNIFHSPNLRHLDLLENSMTGALPKSNWTAPLVFLDLSYNRLTGRLLDSVQQLKNLEALHLDRCGLTGVLPSWVGNHTRMTSLRLGGNQLIGSIPRSIGNLNKLMELDLSSNQLSGNVDLGLFSGMKDLHDLRLAIDDRTDYGSSNYSFPKLEVLALTGGNLTRFPYFIRSLDGLIELDLSWNKISGSVPSWFWNVSRDTLEILNLESNHIEGEFQCPWTKLIDIRFGSNSLKGPLALPPPSLVWFDAAFNNFTGTIGSSFCRLHSLEGLDLAHNNLFGTLPNCLGNSTQLLNLDLSDNNFHGEVPRHLANTTWLYQLNLSYNRLEDTFPSWLGESTSRITFRNLEFLDISNNNFRGSWPAELLRQSRVSIVDLSDNHFHGPIPLPPPNILFFSASNNKFSGKIPPMICSATELQVLDLSNNSLEGNLPPCLMNLSTNNSVLNLRMNKIGGIIPEIYKGENGLRTLDLSQNRFTGTLPPSLRRCRQLQVLDLSDNLIEDTFPNWLGALPELKVLILRSNKFHGVVNASNELDPFPNLRILDLSKNNFSGLLHGSYFTSLKSMITSNRTMSYLEYSSSSMSYRDSVTVQVKGLEITFMRILSIFTSIDMSENSFWGPIPAEIGMLKSLKGLNLSHNNFTRSIPPSIGDLSSIEWLDLSVNMLDGVIPQHLSDITSLAVLNLSENQLLGQIPTGRQFNTFNVSSFSGNSGLCGFPLPNSCSNITGTPPPPSHIGQKAHGGHEDMLLWWMAASMGYGPGLVLGISMGYIFLKTGRPKWLARYMYRKDAKVMKRSRRKARSSQR